jgi:hypothetical protein
LQVRGGFRDGIEIALVSHPRENLVISDPAFSLVHQSLAAGFPAGTSARAERFASDTSTRHAVLSLNFY